MTLKEQYDKINPYKEVIQLFAKCGEYVGGGDGLFEFMAKEFNMDGNTRCPSCMSAMLLRANQVIEKYEQRICKKI